MKINLIDVVIAALKKTLNISEQRTFLPDTRLKEDLGLDSMTSLTFLLTLEEMLDGFVVDPEKLDMRDLDSIKTIAVYVQRELEGSAYA